MSDDYNVTNTNSTELMCDDRLRQLFVIPFIKNYINTMESEQPITFIDLDHMIIPNGFIILGFFCIPMIYYNDLLFQDWDDGAMGALIFGGFLFLIGVIGEFILRKESIGLGDVKLGLVLGAILGSKFSILALYLSFASAAISIMLLLGMNRIDTSNKIPFGPYISMGTFLTFMTSTKSGENFIINWYLSTLM